ncbi:MAG: hypothetical protein AVO33_04205 [delta proteobacterium ML8_F1]|nr:MAG: hypothetical protein AVO33_04205 [delta proteobacterium ML8_F1]
MRIGINGIFLKEGLSGMGNYTVELFNELVRYPGHEYVVFLSCPGGLEKRLDKGIQVVCLSQEAKTGLGLLFLEQFVLPFYLRRHRIDLVFAPAYTLPLLSGKPSLVTVHDMIYKMRIDGGSLKAYWYRRFFYTASLKKAWRILTISQASRRDIIKYFPKQKNISVIPLGPVTYPLSRQKKPSGVRDEGPFLLMVGAVLPRKNSLRVIKALLSLEEREDLKLVIAGEVNGQSREVIDFIRNQGLKERVIVTGSLSIEELAWCYAHGEILVFPSLYEGFGLPPLEAMAAGMPVIASSTTSLPEVVGEAGILVDPFSVEEIARAIEKILTEASLKETLVRRGYDRAKAFSWEKTALETLSVIRELEK